MFSRIFTVLIVVAFISCGSDDELSDEKRELSQARQKWNSAQIQNYSINERISCFCAGLLEWDVYVRNGIKNKVVFDESLLYDGQTYDDVFANAKTVEDAFDFIENLLTKDVASMTVEYDEVYGFPTLIRIDICNFIICKLLNIINTN